MENVKQKDVSVVELAARIAHEINKLYRAALGDLSQPSWFDAPQWQKDSAVSGVAAIKKDPTRSPSASHESWLKQKQDEGWKYGPVKDPEKKEHPCFVSYDQLPSEQKAKDHIFTSVVKGILGVTV